MATPDKEKRFKLNFLFQMHPIRAWPKLDHFDTFFEFTTNEEIWSVVRQGISDAVITALGCPFVPTWESLIALPWVDTSNHGAYLKLTTKSSGARYLYSGSTGSFGKVTSPRGGLNQRRWDHESDARRKSPSLNAVIHHAPRTKVRFATIFQFSTPAAGDITAIVLGRSLVKVVEAVVSFWLGDFDYIESELVNPAWWNLSAVSALFDSYGAFTWLGCCMKGLMDEGIAFLPELNLMVVEAVYEKWLALPFEELPAAARKFWTPKGIPDQETRAKTVKIVSVYEEVARYRAFYRNCMSTEDLAHSAQRTARYRARSSPLERELNQRISNLRTSWVKGRHTEEEYTVAIAKLDSELKEIRGRKASHVRAKNGTYRSTPMGERLKRCLA